VTHADLLAMLLPPVSYAPGERLGPELAAEGAALDAVLADAPQAIRGINPFQAAEWIEDYERVYGLPDACGLPAAPIRSACPAWPSPSWSAGGSPGLLRPPGKLLGYDIGITEYKPFSAGSCAGDSLTNGGWRYAWCVQTAESTVRRFAAGRSCAGEALAEWGDEYLECVMRRLKPAHTAVLFAYRPGIGYPWTDGDIWTTDVDGWT
jgi:uncharacterized protein YmfQ (DUF2313 family)